MLLGQLQLATQRALVVVPCGSGPMNDYTALPYWEQADRAHQEAAVLREKLAAAETRIQRVRDLCRSKSAYAGVGIGEVLAALDGETDG